MRAEVQTVQAAFDAFAERDLDGLLEVVHPDLVVEPATPARRVSRRGRYQGHQGVRRFFTEAVADWAFYRVTALESRRLAPGLVAVEGTVIVADSEGGLGTFAGWVFTVADGRITRLETFLTREAFAARLAAGGVRLGKLASPHPRSDLQEDPVADYAKDVLVETQWVEEHLDDDSVRIVEVDENPALYAEAHIPGAIGFDWKKDLQDQVKRDFLGPEEFGELFGSRGISNDHTVVLYGDRNNWFAAYTYWYLKYYGHDKVKLMNGPREKWIAEGRPTTTDVPSYPPATFTARPGDPAIRAMRDEVMAALKEDGRKLVDVRSPQEYSGELIAMAGYEQEGAQRAGHIPGAASVPWAQAVREDGTFKSADELEELYAGKGVLTGDPVIAYCRIGERSAHTWFVLHELLGQDDVKNYDGSWTEWGNMVAVPIEKDV